MLTIWSKFIQSLVYSEDESSVKLALALVDDKLDFYRWAVQFNLDRLKLKRLNHKATMPIHEYAQWCIHNNWMATGDCKEYLEEKLKKINYVDYLE